MKIINYSEFKNNNALREEFFQKIDFERLESVDLIIDKVRNEGDEALIELSKKFKDGDFENPCEFLVSENEIEKAFRCVSSDLIESVKFAIKNVEDFAKEQLKCIKNLENKKAKNY